MANNKEKLIDSLTFLAPWHLIKTRHFSRKDVNNIKNNLAHSFSYVYLIAAAGLIILISSLAIYMRIKTNDHVIEYYGIMGLVGQIIIVLSSFFSILLIVLSKIIKKAKLSLILARIGGDLLYVGISSYMLCCIYTDAEKGFTNTTEALSAGIVFVAILALVQPMYWADAAILDTGTSVGILSVAIYCRKMFEMKAIEYYGLVALIFPFACYMVLSLLFYAESQHYREILENEKLHNRAYYDKLTHCKNRYALAEFLKENKKRWENNDNANLLMILFDIDDFKLYNDQFSHLGGDYCLKSICDAVRQEFPSPSLDFYRYGGEEFLLFFELSEENEAPVTLEKVRKAISKLEIVAPNGAPKKMVTVSLGGLFLKNISTFVFEDKMRVVDEYLYQAKRSGKDVACYNGTIIN